MRDFKDISKYPVHLLWRISLDQEFFLFFNSKSGSDFGVGTSYKINS